MSASEASLPSREAGGGSSTAPKARPNVIGIVGGTGLSDLEGLTDRAWRRVSSPFGQPADELLFGRFGEHAVERAAFLIGGSSHHAPM